MDTGESGPIPPERPPPPPPPAPAAPDLGLMAPTVGAQRALGRRPRNPGRHSAGQEVGEDAREWAASVANATVQRLAFVATVLLDVTMLVAMGLADSWLDSQWQIHDLPESRLVTWEKALGAGCTFVVFAAILIADVVEMLRRLWHGFKRGH